MARALARAKALYRTNKENEVNDMKNMRENVNMNADTADNTDNNNVNDDCEDDVDDDDDEGVVVDEKIERNKRVSDESGTVKVANVSGRREADSNARVGKGLERRGEIDDDDYDDEFEEDAVKGKSATFQR